MESPKEAERLLQKSDEDSSREQLLLTGLSEGMIAIDAGGGAGFVTKIMSEIVGPKGKVILVDQSKERLKAAKQHLSGCKNVTFIESDLTDIRLDPQIADYVFCRFVFEYLEDQRAVFDELSELLKVDGKLVLGDLDHNCLSHYPLAPHIQEQLNELSQRLEELKLWDPYAGRKLFSYFYEASFDNIRVHMIPHHLIYGVADQRDLDNWTRKLEQMEELSKKGVLKLSFDLSSFKNEFFAFFENPQRFSYSPLFLVEGEKPE